MSSQHVPTASRTVRTDTGDRPLRVAFFTDTFVPTHDGVAQVTDTLARTLTRLGHAVVVFTVRPPGEPGWTIRPDGVQIRRFLSVAAPSYPQYRIAALPWFPSPDGRKSFDVIHIHTPGVVGLAGLLAARRWGVPTVGTYHTDLAGMLRGSGRTALARRFFRAWGQFAVDLCAKCDVATAPTEASRATLARQARGPMVASPVLVPNGVDTTVFRPDASRGGEPSDRGGAAAPMISFVGRLTRDKGYQRFLGALELLGRRRDWVAVLAGDGPHRHEVERMVGPGTPLADRVRYLGPISEEEKAHLLARTRVFVLPSLSDTSSVALLEALASGAAAVVTERGGPAEIARSSGAGIVVDPEDLPAIARAIEALLAPPVLSASAPRAGREWVIANASSDRMAEAYVSCYRRAVRAKRGHRPP